MRAPPAVEAQVLSRRFGEVVAVDGISFAVSPGEVFGLLGPNGAGKTTTISMLTTLLRPTTGRALVAGHDCARSPDLVRRAIGVVFQEPTLDERLTARENLDFHAALYGIGRATRQVRVSDALHLAELEGRAHDRVERFSGGMRRRLEIARGLLHGPAVLFLDEPTVGLDPQTRRSIWERILALRGQHNLTVVMTTHYMEEAEWCDRIAVIDRGRIVALETPTALKRSAGRDLVDLRAANPEELLAFLAAADLSARRCDGSVQVEVADGDRFVPWLLHRYRGGVEALSVRRPTLDDVFVRLTGHAIRDDGLDAGDVARSRFRQAMVLRSRR